MRGNFLACTHCNIVQLRLKGRFELNKCGRVNGLDGRRCISEYITDVGAEGDVNGDMITSFSEVPS